MAQNNKQPRTDWDESKFIVGLDIGNLTSSLSYFDVNRAEPAVIDASGGYGKASVPTVIQYIEETKEWVFGEYAVLNRGGAGEITFDQLIGNLGRMMYFEVSGKAVGLAYILSLYLRELVRGITNLNPNAEMLGIVVSVPSYFPAEAKKELQKAFKLAGLDKKVLAFAEDRICVFYRYLYDKPVKPETVLLLDFGGGGVRGGVYAIANEAGQTNITSVSSLFDDDLGTQAMEDAAAKLFEAYYLERTEDGALNSQTQSQIQSFTYQHKDFLFQKAAEKPVKLYFNFAYPAFQKTVMPDEIETLIQPFRKKLERFLIRLFSKTTKEKLQTSDINTVICTGGGFEMLWARTLLKNAFPLSRMLFYKNAKACVSEGASIVCAAKLGVLRLGEIQIIDRHRLTNDIGVKIQNGGKDKFIAIMERCSFWWQTGREKSFILNETTDQPVSLEIYKRDEQGELSLLDTIAVTGLPARPKGTTKLKLSLEFESYQNLKLTVEDMGFGELFPKSDYEQTISVGYYLPNK